jgi:hypothetical protein
LGVAAVLLALAGTGWYWSGWYSSAPPSDKASLQIRLAAQLPSHFRLTNLEVQPSRNVGTRSDPVFREPFRATFVLAADTFVQSSVEDGVVFIAPRVREGAVQEVTGAVVSKRSEAGVWKGDLVLDANPTPDLGSPRSTFEGDRVIVVGSPEEAAVREDWRRRDQDTLAAEARVKQETLARLEEARRQAERARAEADLERLRTEAEQEAAARKAQQELAEQQRAEAERVARQAVEVERQREAGQQRESEDIVLVEIPAGTELNVRLSRSLNSGTARVEDRFEATTIAELKIDGRVVVPAKSAVRGIVASVQRATRTNRTAKMTLSFDQLTVNGRTYPIRGAVKQEFSGPGLKGEAVRTGAAAGVGALIGGLLGGGKGAAIGAGIGSGGTLAATEGRELEIPVGTIVRVTIETPVVIP